MAEGDGRDHATHVGHRARGRGCCTRAAGEVPRRCATWSGPWRLRGSLLAPVTGTYLPAIDLPLPSFSSRSAGPSGNATFAHDSREVQRPDPGGAAPRVTQSAHGASQTPTETLELAVGLAPAETAPAMMPRVGGWPGLDRLTSGLTLPRLVLGLWLLGAVMLLMRTGLGFLATRRLRRRAAPPVDPEWARLAGELTGQLGLTRSVRVLSSSRAAMPMTWGWWRPVVLVPATGDWSTARKRVVLLHELSHVGRHDCVWQFVANLAVSVYWFNPLVWLAVRAQRVERERACDDAVLQAGTRASSYADHLLEIARGHREPRWSGIAAVAMARRSQLEGRLLSILAPSRRPPTSRGLAVAVTTAMTVAIVSLAAVTPSVRAASRGEGAPVVGVAAPAAYTQVAVAPVAPASEAPASSTAPREGRGQQPEPEAVQATLEQAHAELRELQRALDDQRGQPDLTGQQSVELEARRDQLAREVAALEARTRQLEGAAESLAGRQDLRVADLEARLQRQRESVRQVDMRNQLRMHEMELARHELEQATERHQANLHRLADDRLVVEDLRLRVHEEMARVQARVAIDHAPLDPCVVELLIESLSDDDAGVRERAVQGLGRNQVPAAAGPLAEALRDTEAGVRAEAAWALGRLRDPTAVAALGVALDDPEPRVRAEVVQALGRIRDTAAVEPLVAALADSEPHIRREAAEALGKLRDVGAVDGLVAALTDSDPSVARHAAEALGQIRDAAAVEGLVAALGHQDSHVVEASAEALGRIRSEEAVDGLTAALRNAEGVAVQQIIQALGRIGGDRSLEALIGVADDASPAVRQAVIETLSHQRWSHRIAPRPNPRTDPDPVVAPTPD